MSRIRACASCGHPLPITGGIPRVRAGRVFLLCGHCPQNHHAARAPTASADDTDERARDDATEGSTPYHGARMAALVAAVGLLSGLAVPRLTPQVSARPILPAIAPVDEDAAKAVRKEAFEPPRRHALAFAEIDGALQELTWYHPLAGKRELPGRDSRRFGATREGSRPECGSGHCGVDLGGEIGTVVHAALPGLVARIVDDESGRAGRYVKLEHKGGIVSYYMHLDRIHPDLVPGVELAAGEPLGTLGASGIDRSEAHLHFQVAMPANGRPEYFVDPEPMLAQAILLDEPMPMPAAE